MTHSPETCWQFTDARDALFWSADVLRQRRLPRLTSLWREVVEAAPVSPAIRHLEKEAVPSLRASHLPDEPEDRYALALAVEKLIGGLSEEDRQLLRLHAWGDWATEARLRAALAMQERARQRGQNLLLNYRLSLRQLAVYLDCDHKTVGRRIRAALRELAKRMQAEGLLFSPATERPEGLPTARKVQRADFGN